MTAKLFAGRSRRLVLAAGVGFVLAAGIAYAAVPGGTQVYTACASKSDGSVRLINPALGSKTKLGHCAANERKVTWNQAGSQGPAGAAGPAGPAGGAGSTGATGATGAAGSAASASLPAGFYSGTVGGPSTALTSNGTAVGSLNLPAGKYLVFASARLLAPSAAANAECFIQPAGQLNSGFANVNLAGTNDRKIVSLSYAVTLSAQTAVALKCDITSGGAVNADEDYLSAIAVASIN
jgi:hypothetical protein